MRCLGGYFNIFDSYHLWILTWVNYFSFPVHDTVNRDPSIDIWSDEFQFFNPL